MLIRSWSAFYGWFNFMLSIFSMLISLCIMVILLGSWAGIFAKFNSYGYLLIILTLIIFTMKTLYYALEAKYYFSLADD